MFIPLSIIYEVIQIKAEKVHAHQVRLTSFTYRKVSHFPYSCYADFGVWGQILEQ